MTDVHDKATRSRNMSAIKGKDTKPEVWFRKELFKRGFRYSLHRKDLPGKPDIVLPKYEAVIFVHGCFWHRHDCHLSKPVRTNPDFWNRKLKNNKIRDIRNREMLSSQNWRVLEVWECALRGKERRDPDELLAEVIGWLHGSSRHLTISGLRNQVTETPC